MVALLDCSVEACGRPVLARGLCGLHYGRKRRLGTVELPPRKQWRMFSNEVVEQGMVLVDAGASWDEAAEQVGMSTGNLLLRASKQGLKRRRGRRPKGGRKLRIPTSPVDLAYLAAMVDGEGCIHRKKYGGYWIVQISNTSDILIDWLMEMGGGRVTVHKKPHGPAGPCKSWVVSARLDVLALLIAIEPYLKIKRDRARMAICEEEERWVTGWEGGRGVPGGRENGSDY